MLKTFLSAGLSLDQSFTTAQGKTFLLKDLLETSLLRFEVNSSVEFWHELPWTLFSYNLALPYEYHWKNYRGEKFYLPQIYDYAFKTLEKEKEDIEAWMTQQKGQFQGSAKTAKPAAANKTTGNRNTAGIHDWCG